jgi:catalase
MPDSPTPGRSVLGSLVLIAVIVAGAAAAFAYTAGWLTPDRLTPDRLVDALNPPEPASLGHRKNHAKGICFTGTFDSNGAGAELSRAAVFAAGQYPALGRLNLGSPNPDAPDATVRVRGMGLQITAPDGHPWRTAMIDSPVFPASTPQDFYALLVASGSKDPNAMKAYAAAHPQIAGFGAWAASAPWNASYAQDSFNSLNSFIFTNTAGTDHAVRWSLRPTVASDPIPKADLAKQAPNFLEQEITDRVAKGPVKWTLVVTVANPGDPTADPTQAWPADRRSVDVGTLTVQKIEQEPDGPCRDINFDPTILPDGIHTSDDPFPAARSSAYAKSYDRRTAEAAHYPHTGAKP